MRALDLAFIAGILDISISKYPRREQVLKEIQRAWKAAITTKTKRIRINITTTWAEDKARERMKEHDEKGKKKDT